MIDTQLILLEGLPATGKSTNSAFIRIQLERNGKRAKWIHEVARPHPTVFFSEACLRRCEYEALLKAHPESAQTLNQIAMFTKNTVGIDLMEVEWNYADAIGDSAFNALKAYHSWDFSLERYEEFALEKWAQFAETALRDKDTVYILDSSLFQAQIFTFLWDNAPYERLERFVKRLCDIVEPLNPALIYFYREDAEATIDYLEKDRGPQDLANIWERDKARPYYLDKPTGAEGFKQFLRDYAASARLLFDALDCRKLPIEISKADWTSYENRMLSFLEIEYKPSPDFLPHNGIYRNEALNLEITINGLTMTDPNGGNRSLVPKSENEFYVERLPTVLCFVSPGQLVISGMQICERWTTTGLIYEKSER